MRSSRYLERIEHQLKLYFNEAKLTEKEMDDIYEALTRIRKVLKSRYGK